MILSQMQHKTHSMKPKFMRQGYAIKNLIIEEIRPRKIRLFKTVLIIRYKTVFFFERH